MHLKVIYELLVGSPIKGDLEEFLKWCKNACENLTDRIVDLNEVGEFFSEQIEQRILDLKSMPATGFHFIRMFFVSSNIDANLLVKQERPKKVKKKKNKFSEWGNVYSTLWDEPADKDAGEDDDEEEAETPYFEVMQDPSELLHLNMIWSIVLESEVEEVFTPAINLLVYSYISCETQTNSHEKRSEFIQVLLNKCFDMIKAESNPSPHVIRRVTHIIREVIQQSEQKGTVGVRPHRSILKGELLDRIVIKQMGARNVWGDEKVERAFVVKLYTSCTLWEFKSEIARLLSLAPKYIEFEFPDKKTHDENEHGSDMQ